ncbi:MAG: SpoIIE family protein phosphatase [Desulfovibrionaceae bacterium]
MSPRTLSYRQVVLILVVGAVIAASLAVTVLSIGQLRTVLVSSEEQGARNLLGQAGDLVKAQHQGLASFRDYAMTRARGHVRDVVGLALQEVEACWRMQADGLLTEAQAKARAIDAVERLRFSDGGYFYAYDEHCVAVAHPDARFKGRDMSHVLDEAGDHLLPKMVREAEATGESFDYVRWPRLNSKDLARKLLYYVWFPQWRWVIGAGLYVDDIDRDEARMFDRITGILRESFALRRIGRDGYFWVFDGHGDVVVHPIWALDRMAADRRIMEPLRAAAEGEGQVRSSGPGGQRWSLVQRFEPLNWYIVATVPEAELEAPARSLAVKLTILSVAIMAAFVGVALVAGSKVVLPLVRLDTHAERLSGRDFAYSPEENSALSNILFPVEAKRLARTLSHMEVRLHEYIQERTRATAAKERLESELRIARNIQADMLPRLGDTPLCAGVDLAASCSPAREVGGDFFDAFPLPDGRLVLIMADVSGKGVPAALFMAQAKTLLRAAASVGGSPSAADILNRANDELADGNEQCMFVTAQAAVLDPATGVLDIANAGHLPPWVYRAAKGEWTALELAPGRPLAVMEDAGFEGHALRLEPGDTVVLYTDGVTEAEDNQDRFYGDQRLAERLVQAGPDPSSILKELLADLERFAQGAEISDDITVLALRWRSACPEA